MSPFPRIPVVMCPPAAPVSHLMPTALGWPLPITALLFTFQVYTLHPPFLSQPGWFYSPFQLLGQRTVGCTGYLTERFISLRLQNP